MLKIYNHATITDYALQMADKINLTQKGVLALGATICCLVFISWVFIHWNLDLKISSFFYDPHEGWYLKNRQPWKFLYQYGTIPGFLLTISAFIGWASTFINPRFSRWQRHLLLIFLTSAIGGGIIVNAILKTYWGRPRPKQVTEFHGQFEYQHIVPPGIPGKGHSFTCGHCTMGFIFITLFAFRRKSKALAYAGGLFGMGYGALISMGRIVQGAHFALDAIWSLGVILIVSTTFYYFILKIPRAGPILSFNPTVRQKWLMAAGIGALVAVMGLFFLTKRPFYEHYEKPMGITSGIKSINILMNVEFQEKNLKFADIRDGKIIIDAQGFAFPNADQELRLKKIQKGDTLNIYGNIRSEGYFSELNHSITLILPKSMKDKIHVQY